MKKPKSFGGFRDSYDVMLACFDEDQDGRPFVDVELRGQIGTKKQEIKDLRFIADWFSKAADWLEGKKT